MCFFGVMSCCVCLFSIRLVESIPHAFCFTHPVDSIPAPGRDFQPGRISDLGKHLNNKDIIYLEPLEENKCAHIHLSWCAMMCHDVPMFFLKWGWLSVFSQCICFLFQKDLWHQDVCAPRIATVIVCDLHWCLNSLRRHRAESRLCWFQDGSTPKIICGYLAYRNQ